MSRPIYGLSAKAGEVCCVPEVPPEAALTKFLVILSSLRTAIERFYDTFFGVAPVVANMSMSARAPITVVVRVRWMNENPGVKFNSTNIAHIEAIKFIYNLAGKDWRTDPLFRV